MIAIIDYGLGNLGSVKNALNKLGIQSIVSSDILELEKASGYIFPGVGSAGAGMELLQKSGLAVFIKDQVKKGKPLLGICLGMQLLFSFSEEGNVGCLDVIKGDVKRFEVKLKVPQIGWNTVSLTDKKNRLLDKIKQSSYFYFVHSYFCLPNDKSRVIGSTEYELEFCSIVQQQNVYGVQFHPEKSGKDGLQLLQNFSDIVYEHSSRN